MTHLFYEIITIQESIVELPKARSPRDYFCPVQRKTVLWSGAIEDWISTFWTYLIKFFATRKKSILDLIIRALDTYGICFMFGCLTLCISTGSKISIVIKIRFRKPVGLQVLLPLRVMSRILSYPRCFARLVKNHVLDRTSVTAIFVSCGEFALIAHMPSSLTL